MEAGTGGRSPKDDKGLSDQQLWRRNMCPEFESSSRKDRRGSSDDFWNWILTAGHPQLILIMYWGNPWLHIFRTLFWKTDKNTKSLSFISFTFQKKKLLQSTSRKEILKKIQNLMTKEKLSFDPAAQFMIKSVEAYAFYTWKYSSMENRVSRVEKLRLAKKLLCKK